MAQATTIKTMVLDKIRNENPHLRSANFELPLYINRVIKEFGSVVATRDKYYFGNIPLETLALIVEAVLYILVLHSARLNVYLILTTWLTF
jgi:hypothetical protein